MLCILMLIEIWVIDKCRFIDLFGFWILIWEFHPSSILPFCDAFVTHLWRICSPAVGFRVDFRVPFRVLLPNSEEGADRATEAAQRQRDHQEAKHENPATCQKIRRNDVEMGPSKNGFSGEIILIIDHYSHYMIMIGISSANILIFFWQLRPHLLEEVNSELLSKMSSHSTHSDLRSHIGSFSRWFEWPSPHETRRGELSELIYHLILKPTHCKYSTDPFLWLSPCLPSIGSSMSLSLCTSLVPPFTALADQCCWFRFLEEWPQQND
jgi:hypothetical protein